MRVFNYSEARQNFSFLLNTALEEEVVIKRRDGSKFKVIPIMEEPPQSPFDIKGIDSDITTADILDFIQEGREDKE